MNSGALNSFSLNSSPGDALVRSTVLGSAYAMADVLNRVVRRSVLSLSSEAQAVPLARALIRSPTATSAQAAASPLLLRMVRDVVASQAQAQAVIWSGMVRSVVSQAVQAVGVVVARVLVRSSATFYGSASAEPVVLRMVRSPLDGSAASQANVIPNSAVRRYLGEAMYLTVQVVGQAVSRLQLRSVIAGQAAAEGLAEIRARRRALVEGPALAVGFVGGGVIVRRPFGEPAIPENTFVVTTNDNVFFVR